MCASNAQHVGKGDGTPEQCAFPAHSIQEMEGGDSLSKRLKGWHPPSSMRYSCMACSRGRGEESQTKREKGRHPPRGTPSHSGVCP